MVVNSEVSGKELAAELVYSFLLPEVERQITREKGAPFTSQVFF